MKNFFKFAFLFAGLGLFTVACNSNAENTEATTEVTEEVVETPATEEVVTEEAATEATTEAAATEAPAAH